MHYLLLEDTQGQYPSRVARFSSKSDRDAFEREWTVERTDANGTTWLNERVATLLTSRDLIVQRIKRAEQREEFPAEWEPEEMWGYQFETTFVNP